jgi:predicted lipoprotein with Yx(FWY)xxD motif
MPALRAAITDRARRAEGFAPARRLHGLQTEQFTFGDQAIQRRPVLHLKHSIVAAAVVSAAVPAGLLSAGAGASIARTADDAIAHAAKAPTVALRKTRLGKVLVVGASGRTLYLFEGDGKYKSNCTGECAAVWPPLMVTGRPSAGRGASRSKIGEIKRGHGHQVTYAGHPLYTFESDSRAGQTSGENVSDFFVVSASGKAIK